jgi:diguanylate cyclase (GGDEF)-like protein
MFHPWGAQAPGCVAVNDDRKLAGSEGLALSGVIDRHGFLLAAAADVARTRRHGSPLSCLAIEVDRFPQVKALRVPAPDESMLLHFVSVCRSSLRESDYIGRLDDNEFVVMLPETPLLSALAVAERILANLAASPRHDLAASIGVAEYEDPSWSVERLLQAALAAMADARQNGHNLAVCYLDDLQLSTMAAPVH